MHRFKISEKVKMILQMMFSIILYYLCVNIGYYLETVSAVVAWVTYLAGLVFLVSTYIDFHKKVWKPSDKQNDKSINVIVYAILVSSFLKWSQFLIICKDSGGFFVRDVEAPLQRFILIIALDWFIYFAVIFIGLLIFRNRLALKIWIGIMFLLSMALNIIQYYTLTFRGEPFVFREISDAMTGLAFAESFKFNIGSYEVFLIVGYIIAMLLYLSVDVIPFKTKKHFAIMVICYVASILLFVLVSNTAYRNNWIAISFGVDIDTNNLDGEHPSVYKYTLRPGVLLGMYYDSLYNRLVEPDDYTTEQVALLFSQYDDTRLVEQDDTIIIGILSESLCDLSNLVDLGSTDDCLPNWRALSENCVKGYVTVSPYGGRTGNSEYEFLTGNSMYFIQENLSVVSNYVNDAQDNVVRYFDKLGFETICCSPDDEFVYNGKEVFNHLGFSKSLFAEDWLDFENVMLTDSTQILTDDYLFSQLEKQVDSIQGSGFVWCLTMQNHSPYDYEFLEGYDWNEHITVDDEVSVRIGNYLTGVKNSDTALMKLIEHYKDSDKKIVIVIFGDHLPWLNGELESNTVIRFNSLENLWERQKTPFLIWTNKDIDYKWIDEISLNYLMQEVLAVADIPLSKDMQFIADVRKEIPVIAGWGYKLADGTWHGREDEYDSDILKKYHMFQWYRMFDKNRKILQE